MFDLCHFLKVTFMRVEDVRLTALETGISIYSQGAGKTRAGAGQAPAQMPTCFFPVEGPSSKTTEVKRSYLSEPGITLKKCGKPKSIIPVSYISMVLAEAP